MAIETKLVFMSVRATPIIAESIFALETECDCTLAILGN